jgi:hypothetical protein
MWHPGSKCPLNNNDVRIFDDLEKLVHVLELRKLSRGDLHHSQLWLLVDDPGTGDEANDINEE